MELFAKQIVNDLKPFQGLCREKDVFAATAKGVLKIFHHNLWKTPV